MVYLISWESCGDASVSGVQSSIYCDIYPAQCAVRLREQPSSPIEDVPRGIKHSYPPGSCHYPCLPATRRIPPLLGQYDHSVHFWYAGIRLRVDLGFCTYVVEALAHAVDPLVLHPQISPNPPIRLLD